MAAYTINTNAAQEALLDKMMAMLGRINAMMTADPPTLREDPTNGLASVATKEELLRRIIIQRVPELRSALRDFENSEMFLALQSATPEQIEAVRDALGLP